MPVRQTCGASALFVIVRHCSKTLKMGFLAAIWFECIIRWRNIKNWCKRSTLGLNPHWHWFEYRYTLRKPSLCFSLWNSNATALGHFLKLLLLVVFYKQSRQLEIVGIKNRNNKQHNTKRHTNNKLTKPASKLAIVTFSQMYTTERR